MINLSAWKCQAPTARRRLIAFLCVSCIAVSLMLSPVSLWGLAQGEYFAITESNANLFINVNQKIKLADVSVVVNGKTVNGADVAWTTGDANVSIANGILQVSAKGSFGLTVEDTEGKTATVTVITKSADESSFVLYEEDFDDMTNGTLPQGWVVTKNEDITTDEAAKHATYVSTPQVVDGKFVMGNGVVSKDVYVLLPDFLDKFSDYVVDMEYAQRYCSDNMRYAGLLTRVNRTVAGETTTFNNAYFYLARRASTTSTGLEICGVGGGSQKGVYTNNIGATRDFGSTTNWKSSGYAMHMSAYARGTSLSMDLYRLPNQPNFDGDLAVSTDGYKGSVPSPAITADAASWASKLSKGGIGLRTTGSQMAVDSIKVSIPANMLDSNPNYYVPSSEQNDDYTYNDIKVGVISDLHVHSYETGINTHLVTMLNRFKADDVDVVLITGDVATTGLVEEYDTFLTIWSSVFTDPATAPKRLVITGNHEFEQAYYGRETVQDVYDKYMNAYGYDTVNFHEVVNGYHFIGINSEGPAVDGKYTETTATWLQQQIDDAIVANPGMPIFVAAHQPLANTTFGSIEGSSKTTAIYNVLKNYPQIVYFAGHTHFPIENERSIHQNLFTSIDVTSLQYVSTESGTPSDAYSAQGGLMFSVEGVNKQMVVNRYRIDGASVRTAKNPWTLSLPLKTATFAYTDARKDSRTAPTFAAGAEPEVSNITVNSMKVTIPAASHDDYVQGYNVYVKEKGWGNIVVSKYFTSDFYLNLANMAKQLTTNIGGMAPNMDYTVDITAVESFGLESEPISKDFSTLPVTDPSIAVARADFLDVNFIKGFADNSPYRLPYNLYGSDNASKIVYSEVLDHNVLSANGWINYPVTKGMLSKITNSITAEVAFKVPEALPVDQCLFGDPEDGGFSVEFDASGTLQVWMHIGGGWKTLNVPNVTTNTWYHLVTTFDGSSIKVYLNGTLAASMDAAGTLYHNPDMLFMTIGANTNTTGNAAQKFIGEMALARIYTKALTAGEASDAFSYFQNNGLYQTIYDKIQILNSLDPGVLDATTENSVNTLITQGEALLADADMEQAAADTYLTTVNALMKTIGASNPSINWLTFQDPCSEMALITNRSSNWQEDSNTTIQKKFLTKNQNIDGYLTYQVDGYIRSFEIAALLYAGFGDAARDIDVYLSENGADWKQLVVNTSPIVDDPAYESGDAVSWQNSTVSSAHYISGEYSYLKLVLKKFDNGVTWSVGIDDIKIFYSDKADDVPMAPGTFVEDEIFVDELENLNKVSSKTDTWDIFNTHAETGLSVIGRKSASFENIISYKPTNKSITGLSIALQYVPDYVDINRDIKVSVRTAATNDWTDLTLNLSSPVDIPNATNAVFKSAQATPSIALPDNIAEVKIQLLNDVLWTLFLDRVTMSLANAKVDDAVPTNPTNPTPSKEFDFVDELENFDKIKDHSDNWEAFNPHPESNLSVIGKTNGKRGYVTYMENGKTITDFAFSLQLAPAFFNQEQHLLVQIRLKDSTEWTSVAVECAAPLPAGNTFFTSLVTPTEALPDNVEELKIYLYNDVAWTLMLNSIMLDFKSEMLPTVTDTSTSETTRPSTSTTGSTNPETGSSSAALPVLLLITGISVMLVLSNKCGKTKK